MGEREKAVRGLPINVLWLGLVSFFADVSTEMLYPLIPIFLTVVLGAPVAAVGLIEGTAQAVASVSSTIFGSLSDRARKRLSFVFSGYLLAALAKPVMALAVAWPLVLVARAADRFGKGMRGAPRDALLADSVYPSQRGRAFGWHRSFDTMGAVVGPLLALLLISVTNNNLRLIILLAFIPGMIGALLVLTVREPTRHKPSDSPRWLRWSAMPPAFRTYLVAWGVFSIANSSDVFLILRAKQLGYGTALIVTLYALYNVVYAIASPYLGGLSDRIGRKHVMRGGLLVFSMVYIAFAFVRAPWQLWVLFAVYGLYIAATEGVGKALAVDLVPASVRGSAVGVLTTVTGITALVASTVAGVLWTAVGSWAAFAFGAAGALLSAALFGFVHASNGVEGA